MGGTPVTPKLERLIAETPVQTVLALEAITHRTGLNQAQVQAAMLRMTKDANPVVEVVSRGYSWRVLRGAPPAAESAAPVFTIAEDLGSTKLLRDADGALWLAKRVGRSE